jgi:nodulation protein E
MHRVVVTGIGVVSPVGLDLKDFWKALVEAKSGIGPLTLVPGDKISTRIAAEVKNFDPEAHLTEKRAHLMDRFAQFAVVAARSAVKDAGLEISESLATEVVTVIGTGIGGHKTLDDSYLRVYGQGASRVHPLTIPRLMVNAGASHISIDLGLKGPTWSVATACASGTHAIGQAFHAIRSGQTAVAVTGGCEACLTFGSIKGWEALRVLSADTCRPFSQTRSGMVLGEGAAVVILEERERALTRGARPYAEVIGFGMSADAADLTAADPVGAARAMRGALKDARRDPEDVDYINAHGTGTEMNDRIETLAIHSVFGPGGGRVAVSSSKGVLGHSLGGSGAFEFAATALALHTQTIPPTANFEKPDPSCVLDCVPNIARQVQLNVAMSNSFAFGGLNAVLVASRA